MLLGMSVTVPISRTIAAVGLSQQQNILHVPIAWRIAAGGLPAQPNVLQGTRRPEHHQPNSLLQVPLVTQWEQQQRSPSLAIATAMIHAQRAEAYQGLHAAALGGGLTGPQDGVEQAQRTILNILKTAALTAACEAHTVSPNTGGKHDASAVSSRGARHQSMDVDVERVEERDQDSGSESEARVGGETAGGEAALRRELETVKRERDTALREKDEVIREKDEVIRGKDAEISRLRALAYGVRGDGRGDRCDARGVGGGGEGGEGGGRFIQS